MKKRNFKRRLSIEQLEGRRLLAADLSVVDMMPTEVAQPETVMCQVAEIESGTEVVEFDTAELPVDAGDAVGPVNSIVVADTIDVTADPQPNAEVGLENEVAPESEVEEADVEADLEADVGTLVHDLGDPVDGTDGFFGSIDAENANQSFAITPSETGMVEVVVASSLNDGEVGLEVTDSTGAIVESTMTADVAGFQKLTFEAGAGQTYQLNVSSAEGAEGHFQVTTSYDADLHADTVGADSTKLEFVDGATAMDGQLEVAGDVDTFRFTAEASGKFSLGLAELNPENATELQVQVLGSAGGLITRGITNETVGISFDVESGGEYFLAVSAGEDQTGSYQVELTLEAGADAVEVEPEVELETTAEPELELEPTAEVTPELELEPTGEPTVEIEPEVEIEPTVEPEVQLESEPEVDFQVEPELESEATAEVTPELELEPTVEPEVEPELGPEVEPGVDPEIVSGVDPELTAGIDADVEPSEGPEVELEATDSLEVDSEVEPTADLEVAVEPKVDLPTLEIVDDATEPSLTFTEADFSGAVSPVGQMESLEDLPEVGSVEESAELTGIAGDVADETVEEEVDVCFSEHEGENEIVDAIFAHFNPDSLFSFAGQFELRLV
jgi:pilus assembly protein FimV